jgi:hypothetical protein
MRGVERRNKGLKSTYGSTQNSELHRAMQTGTVPRELTGRVKKIKQNEPVCFILLLT